MTYALLAKRIGILTAFVAVIVLVLQRFNQLGDLSAFTWFCLAYFCILSLVMLALGMLAKTTQKPGTTSFVFLGTIMFKSLLTLCLVIGYFFLYKPSSPTFILPLGAMYIVYSLVTTSSLIQISKSV